VAVVDEVTAIATVVTAWHHPAEDPQLVIMEWILSRDWPSSATNAKVLVTSPEIAQLFWRPNAIDAKVLGTWLANARPPPPLAPTGEASSVTNVARWATWRAIARSTKSALLSSANRF